MGGAGMQDQTAALLVDPGTPVNRKHRSEVSGERSLEVFSTLFVKSIAGPHRFVPVAWDPTINSLP